MRMLGADVHEVTDQPGLSGVRRRLAFGTWESSAGVLHVARAENLRAGAYSARVHA